MSNIFNQIICGDALSLLKQLPNNSIHCCVTSPPYFGLRNYNVDGQIGLEETPKEYVSKLVEVFAEVYRVLRSDGTFWLNLGDSFQKKNLLGIPWRVAFALQDFGWYLRSDIIWAKSISFNDKYVGSCMPEAVKDRPTRSHEYLFLLTKSLKYFYDLGAVKEEGVFPAGTKAAKGSGTREGNRRDNNYAIYSGKRNLRTVWTVQTKPYKDAHFAVFPEKLVEPCIKAGTSSYGCCAECGNSYYPIIDNPGNPEGILGYRGIPNAKTKAGGFDSEEREVYNVEKIRLKKGHNPTQFSQAQQTGWQKQCKCVTKEVSRPIVLDPFIGSGTVAVVAKQLNCDYIGLELNPLYCEIAKKRLDF